MTKRVPFRVKLFIVSALVALLVIAGTFLMMRLFADLDANHHLSSVSHVLARVCFDFLVVATWPAMLYAIIADHPSFPADVIFYLVSGLFWALMVDLLFVILRKIFAEPVEDRQQ
jgi:hypothetical protein